MKIILTGIFFIIAGEESWRAGISQFFGGSRSGDKWAGRGGPALPV